MHKERSAIGMQVVSYTAASTDENAFLRLVIRCSTWSCLGNSRDLKSPRFIVRGLPEVDFVSRLTKSQLAEGAQIGTLEKSGERLLHHLRFIDRSPLEAIEQRVG